MKRIQSYLLVGEFTQPPFIAASSVRPPKVEMTKAAFKWSPESRDNALTGVTFRLDRCVNCLDLPGMNLT